MAVTQVISVQMRRRREKIKGEMKLPNGVILSNLRLEFRTFDPLIDDDYTQRYEYIPGIYVTGEYETSDGEVYPIREYVDLVDHNKIKNKNGSEERKEGYYQCINNRGSKTATIRKSKLEFALNISWEPGSLIKGSQNKILDILMNIAGLLNEAQPEKKTVMSPEEYEVFREYMLKKYNIDITGYTSEEQEGPNGETNGDVVPIVPKVETPKLQPQDPRNSTTKNTPQRQIKIYKWGRFSNAKIYILGQVLNIIQIIVFKTCLECKFLFL